MTTSFTDPRNDLQDHQTQQAEQASQHGPLKHGDKADRNYEVPKTLLPLLPPNWKQHFPGSTQTSIYVLPPPNGYYSSSVTSTLHESTPTATSPSVSPPSMISGRPVYHTTSSTPLIRPIFHQVARRRNNPGGFMSPEVNDGASPYAFTESHSCDITMHSPLGTTPPSESFIRRPLRRRRRPPHSYASMIAQAILSSSNQRMTLRDIYDWIQRRYPQLYEANETGWQNTIRHNLSLNRCFLKLPRQCMGSPRTKGKGGYWGIDIKTLYKSSFGRVLFESGAVGSYEYWLQNIPHYADMQKH